MNVDHITDKWIEAGNYSEQTVKDLREAVLNQRRYIENLIAVRDEMYAKHAALIAAAREYMKVTDAPRGFRGNCIYCGKSIVHSKQCAYKTRDAALRELLKGKETT